MNNIILWLVTLSFLPFSIHIGIGIRFFDILFVVLLLKFLYIKKIIINKFTLFLFIMFVVSILSLLGLFSIDKFNESIYFHIKNILMGSFRYIEVLIVFIGFYYSNRYIKSNLFRYVIYGIILNDIYSFFSYLANVYNLAHNDIFNLIFTGKYIYNFRFLESVNSVNGSAGFLVMTLPLLWYSKNIINKFLWILLISLHFLLLFLTASKSALLGTLLFFILVFLFDKKTNIVKIGYRSLLFVITLTLIWNLIPEPIKKYRINGVFKGDKSTTERIVRAKKSIYIVKESPLFGYGFSSTYKYLFKKYAIGYERNWIRGVSGHNTYITLLVQIGVFGFFFFMFYFLIILFESFSIMFKRVKNFLFYLSISIILFIIISATDDMLFIPTNFFVFFIILILFYLHKKQRLYYVSLNNNSFV